MNCQDFARILDEQEVDSLLAEEQSAVQAHLATCRDCARDWRIHQRLRGAAIPAVPAELRAQYAVQVAAVADKGARRRSRFVVIGALVVVAAAAAMLVWQTSSVRPKPQQTEIAVTPTIRDPAAVAVEQVVPPAPVVEEQLAALPMPELPPAASPRYSVLVKPLRQDTQDAAGRGQVEAFYSSVLEELRKAPGVVLQVPGGSEDYVLTITSLATQVSPSGNLQVRATDGGATYAVGRNLGGISMDMDYKMNPLTGKSEAGESRSYEAGGSGGAGSVAWIEMRVESSGAAPAWYTFPIGAEGSSSQRQCATSEAIVKAECLTPAKLAAKQVEQLRLQVFPPDAALQQGIVARLGNARLTQAEQMQLLQQLLTLNAAPGGSGPGSASRLDGAALLALTRVATTLPAFTRTQVWSMLRHVSHPVLITPLIESVHRDADRQVRLAALATLMASYAAEPGVRTALESVAQKDTDEVVRIAARRELYGPTQWRNDVIAVLNNTALPYESRVAPLRESTAPFSVSQTGDLQSLMQDRQVLFKLVDLVRENLGDAGKIQATREMLLLLSGTKDPAVSELFAEARRNGIQSPGNRYGSGAITMIDGRIVDGSGQNVDEEFVPSGLLERMREVTESRKPAGQ